MLRRYCAGRGMQQTTEHGFVCNTICSPSGKVQAKFVPQRGGIMASLKISGRELLYRHPEFWDPDIDDLPGAWPFCFPVCARLSYRNDFGAYKIDNELYKMPIHGLGWWNAWSVKGAGENWIELEFVDNEQTRAMYPFQFCVTLRYEIFDDQLLCQQTYFNKSASPMPYYAGFHPYFLMPDNKADVTLNYKPEKRFVYNSDYTEIIGEQDLFCLPSSVCNPDLNEQLTKLGSDKTAYLNFPDGLQLSINVAGDQDPDMFSFMQLYTQADKNFFCVEPWMAAPNSLNTGDARLIQAGAHDSALLTLAWTGL